jgi:hypothetical protein
MMLLVPIFLLVKHLWSSTGEKPSRGDALDRVEGSAILAAMSPAVSVATNPYMGRMEGEL